MHIARAHQLGARFADVRRVRSEEVSAVIAVSHWPEHPQAPGAWRLPLAVARSRLDPPPSPVSSYLGICTCCVKGLGDKLGFAEECRS